MLTSKQADSYVFNRLRRAVANNVRPWLSAAETKELLEKIERLQQCHREGWLHADEMKGEFERRGKEIERLHDRNAQFKRALHVIAAYAGRTFDGVSCTTSWCADEARKGLRSSPDETNGCQHDLLKPGTTIEVIDPWKAKCKVCIEFFDLPGRPENGSGDV